MHPLSMETNGLTLVVGKILIRELSDESEVIFKKGIETNMQKLKLG